MPLNQKLKLNPKLFNKDVEQVPIRKGFGEGLLVAGENDKRVVGVCADLTESTQMNLFKEKFPERFVEVGVAEQNMASVGSGLAAMGKIPFITSYAAFNPGRNWEQIRTTIAYNDQKVIVIGSHAGVSVGPDGGSHQATEDLAIMRVIPNMAVLAPIDSIQAKMATIESAKDDVTTPVYMRLAREKTPVITTSETPFQFGKAQHLFIPKTGNADVTIFVTGSLAFNTLVAAQNLEARGINVSVIAIHTIKPLDIDAVINAAQESGAVVTVEEHQIAGGLGGAIAETLAANCPTPIEFVGVKDLFGQSGTPAELIEYYEMGFNAILNAATKVIKRKGK